MRTAALLVLSLALAACGGRQPRPTDAPPPVPANMRARAEMRDATGRAVGTVNLTQTANGVLLSGDLSNLPSGVHAIHFHDVGRCDPPFTSAGGHFNPTQRGHGFQSPAGYHAGDLPNFTASTADSVRVDHFTREVTLGTGPTSLLDADGSSIVVHSGADDYRTDPSGNSGERVACGIIVR